MIYLPEGFDFAFLIVDDTDCSTLPEIKEVYDCLYQNGLRTNKTVWVFPPKDEPKNYGDSLSDNNYARWVQSLSQKGFEIGLHNVGSGDFKREEIIAGLEKFKDVLGYYPNLHVNHSYNTDNIYSGEERFGKIFSQILKTAYPKYKGFQGNDINSEYFWGDRHKELIKYSRNVELPSLNLARYLSKIPFVYSSKKEFSNYWYPVTFAPNPWMWNKMINESSIDKLKRQRGAAIVYTHFGYYHLEHGELDTGFKTSIEYLGKQRGWYVTLSEFLDYQLLFLEENELVLTDLQEFYLDLVTLYTRIKYRYFNRLDDYHFKRYVGIKW